MASYVSKKMKRKDLENVSGDFSDLWLSTPAAKIRRLDGELIVDNRQPVTTSVGKEMPAEEMCCAVLDGRSGLTEAILSPGLNGERALVMYKPPDVPFASSLKINPKLVTCLKNLGFLPTPYFVQQMVRLLFFYSARNLDYTFWPRNPNMLVEEDCGKDTQPPSNKCLAMVPWAPSHVTVTRQVMHALASGNEPAEEPMESEDAAAAHMFMEIEEENGKSDNTGVGALGNHQWQQHCMTPQLLQSNSTMAWS